MKGSVDGGLHICNIVRLKKSALFIQRVDNVRLGSYR